MSENTLREIQKDRQQYYGSPSDQFRTIGEIWASTLSAHFGNRFPSIPAHIVAIMMAQSKLNRASMVGTKYRQDNYVDAMSYIQLADDTDSRKASR